MTNVLSKREVGILIHLANGLTSKEICAVEDLSKNTVAEYRLRISDKLERAGLIHSRSLASLVRYAVHAGLVTGTN